MRLGAALINADHGELAAATRAVGAAGLDFVHLDVFDGRLVPDLAFSPRTLQALRPHTALPFEVHLVAGAPLPLLPALAEAGCDLVLLHVEGAPMLFETLYAVREQGMRAGIALSLATPLAALEAALPFVESVLLLSRVTGEGTRGAGFDDRVLPRARRTRGLIDELAPGVELQVAGGVNRENIVALHEAGVDAVSLGAGLYRAPDMAVEVAALRALVGQAE